MARCVSHGQRTVELELGARGLGLRQLLGRADDVGRASEQIHATRVEKRRDVGGGQQLGAARKEAVRALEKAPQLGLGPRALGEEGREARDNIVRAGALTAAEDDTEANRGRDLDRLAAECMRIALGDELEARPAGVAHCPLACGAGATAWAVSGCGRSPAGTWQVATQHA